MTTERRDDWKAPECNQAASLSPEELQLRRALEQLPVGAALVAATGRMRWSNAALRRIFGCGEAKPLPAEVRSWTRPGDACFDLARAADLISGQSSQFETESRFLRHDGTEMWGRLIVRPIDGLPGSEPLFLAILIDTHERREAQQALVESEERFRTLAAASFEAIVISESGRIIDVNEQFLRLYFGSLPMAEQCREEVIGRDVAEFVVPEERVYLTMAARGDAPSAREYHGIRKDGTVITVEIRGRMIDYQGRKARIAVLRDVTLERASQERMRQRAAELAHAARLSALGELVASLAHEVDQPLQAISNYAYGGILRLQSDAISKKCPEDEELQTALSRIHKEAERAGLIVRGVRAFLKRREPSWELVSLSAVIEDTVRLLASEAQRRQARVSVKVPATMPPVLGDRVQLEQVVLNLVRNAIESMEDTPVERRVVVVSIEPDKHTRVTVRVQDAGCGLPAGALDKVFNSFYTTKEDGLGMGLAI
ncbi:MAG: PAS domain S-box protein, partial [Planctomycetota bacterium]